MNEVSLETNPNADKKYRLRWIRSCPYCPPHKMENATKRKIVNNGWRKRIDVRLLNNLTSKL